MRRFHFKLEPVLHVRRNHEEQAERELSERRQSLAREVVRFEELQREQQRHETARAELQRRKASVDIRALVDADQYGAALSRAAWSQQLRVDEAKAAVRGALDLLRERRVERETMEQLRRRQFEEHRAEQLAMEQKTLDETAVLRWRRK